MQASLAAVPESPLDLVARGDFSKLSLPILVAAMTAADVDAFRERHGLLAFEVRRYREPMCYKWLKDAIGRDIDLLEGRVLLLLPGWDEDPSTCQAVLHWVRSDRYTVEMDEVRAPVRCACPELLWMALGLAVVLATWLTLAWLGGR
jgi:hypothetical protein